MSKREMRIDKKKISPEHVLPCDFVCGPIRFRKGVKLETVRAAAERWFKAAAVMERGGKL